MAGGSLIHPLAAEAGAIFTVSATQAPETLSGSNTKVVGSFVTGTNYVGVDLIRVRDTTTEDSVKILSEATKTEFSQTIPLARTLEYRIYIQTADFDHSTNVLPIAIVVVDNSGSVVSVTDARRMAFRLGTGGTNPSSNTSFPALPKRTETILTVASGNSTDDPFSGGDKDLGSVRDWMTTVMSRIWEIGGGVHWYSPSSSNDLRLVYDTTSLFAQTSENWYWVGGNLLWKGLNVFLSNSEGGSYNEIADQASASVGLTDLVNGDCLYVDVDRTYDHSRSNNTGLVVTKAVYATLGTPTIPGSRLVIAWRNLNEVYVANELKPVNSGSAIENATTTVFGGVKMSCVSAERVSDVIGHPEWDIPVVAPTDLEGKVVATGLTCWGAFGDSIAGILSIGKTSSDQYISSWPIVALGNAIVGGNKI